MKRHELTDEQWERLDPLLPPQKPHTGRPNKDHRIVISGFSTKIHVRAEGGGKPMVFLRTAFRERNRVERLINKVKGFRRIATRYEKRAVHYLGMLVVAAIVFWL